MRPRWSGSTAFRRSGRARASWRTRSRTRPIGCTPRSMRWRRRSPCSPHAVEINRLENEADRAYQEAVQRAVRHETDPIIDHEVEGALRRARADHGLLRGRRQRHRRRRRQARIAACDALDVRHRRLIIVVALVFDYINGFHDAANSIATVVSTRVLSPLQAVAVGGVLQFRRGGCVRHGRGEDRRLGDGRLDGRHLRRDPRRPDRRHHLESDHVVLRPADQLVARAVRRLRAARRSPRPGSAPIIVSGWTKTIIFIVARAADRADRRAAS